MVPQTAAGGMVAIALHNVLPAFSMNNSPDGIFAYPEFFRQGDLTLDAIADYPANLSNRVFVKFGVAMCRPARHATFLGAVNRVVPNSAEKKVGRVDARRVVTGVADEKRRRVDGSVVQFPAESGGPAVVELTVAIPILGTSPDPASFRLFHLGPEPCLGRYESEYVKTRLGTAGSLAGVAVGNGERFAALTTGQ